MSGSRLPDGVSGSDYVYIVLYRLRILDDEEKKDWIRQWAAIRKDLPKGIHLVTEAGHAFGTDFTGFSVFEGPFDKFDDLMSILDLHTRHLIEKTKTIIGTKGLSAPSSQLRKIMKARPID